ncbi:MAG: hypothetical protein K2X38_17825 [Gemmataceae bacterium]|nr:hypothetical protein [Gemmataceae bacterium]
MRSPLLPIVALCPSSGVCRPSILAALTARLFQYSGALSETVLLGNLAYRANAGKLQYDPRTGRFANAANAEQYLRREYRGWSL